MDNTQGTVVPGEVEEKAPRMLGALVDDELYWHFKMAAATRNESLKEAVAHAARMYIDTPIKKEQKEN